MWEGLREVGRRGVKAGSRGQGADWAITGCRVQPEPPQTSGCAVGRRGPREGAPHAIWGAGRQRNKRLRGTQTKRAQGEERDSGRQRKMEGMGGEPQRVKYSHANTHHRGGERGTRGTERAAKSSLGNRNRSTVRNTGVYIWGTSRSCLQKEWGKERREIMKVGHAGLGRGEGRRGALRGSAASLGPAHPPLWLLTFREP